MFITCENDLMKLKHHQPFSFICRKCGKIHTINQFRNEPYRIERYKTFYCEDCYRCEKSMKLYGVDNPMKSKELLDKVAKTNFERYGYRSPLQNNKVKHKANLKMVELYGKKNYVETEEFKIKSSETKRLRYNDPNYSNREKKNNTMIERYGVDNPMKCDEFKNKSLKTRRDRYGEHCEKITEKVKSTMINNFKTNPEKYLKRKGKYCYMNLPFDSVEELCVYIYCLYCGIPIIRNFNVGFNFIDSRGNLRFTFPDFIILGKCVEIKGSQFFDENGIMKCPYKNENWTSEEYKFRNSLYKDKQQCLLNNNVMLLRDTNFWVVMCKDFVKNVLKINTEQFAESNINNIGYGYTPYNISISNSNYCESLYLGIIPNML